MPRPTAPYGRVRPRHRDRGVQRQGILHGIRHGIRGESRKTVRSKRPVRHGIELFFGGVARVRGFHGSPKEERKQQRGG